ncbi:GNAT family N-acetyltransferase [Rubrivirga sp.]|uniref:GNAT family N-acetyltransferase n=1 Tax=Rubrivirga sp. TaxID=1885344 RepID=UPI003C792241
MIRPLHDADLEAARSLWNRSAPHDPLSETLFAEKACDPSSRSIIAVLEDETVGLAVGVPWSVPGAERGSVRLLAVAPEHRRRGIGAALLETVADDLHAQGATVLRIAEAAPNYLTPGVDVRYDAATPFLEAAGFHRIGESVNLGVDLEADDWSVLEDEKRLAEAGVEVRRAGSDRAAIGRLLDANWPPWHAEVAIGLEADPPSIHLALRDGEVLGFAAHSTNNAELGWFGPMGTSPAARGLGIGAVLLKRCLADLRMRGLENATIAWAAALPFYERACGATVSRRFQRWERAL